MYPNHMTEKSGNGGVYQTTSTSATIAIKRGRGRPKGAKNKPKELRLAAVSSEPKKRGRPKGAKNKPKDPAEMLVKLKPREEDPAPGEAKRRGRPRKVVPVAASTQEPVAVEANSLDNHPLILAARWIEKNMHPTEMQYYRTRANRNGTSLVHTMVGDLLGFFNVQNAEICKQIKKNNFIDKVCNS